MVESEEDYFDRVEESAVGGFCGEVGSADGLCGGGDQGQIDGLGEELQLEFDGGWE